MSGNLPWDCNSPTSHVEQKATASVLYKLGGKDLTLKKGNAIDVNQKSCMKIHATSS